MIENIFEEVNCPICGSKDSQNKFSFKFYSNKALNIIGYSGTIPNLLLNKCKACFHHFANPQIKSDFLEKYYFEYNSEYYNLDIAPNNHLTREHKLIYKKISEISNGGKILEIGCGFGFLLNEFPDSKWEKYGVEPSKFASNFAKKNFNINIHNGFLNFDTFESHFFDAIIFFDLIEHLKYPNEFLKIVKHYLKPKGIIVFGTGNISSINAKLSGKLWSYFSSWEHISFYSPSSVKYLFLKNNLKLLKIDKLSYCGSNFLNNKYFFTNIFVIHFKNFLKKTLNNLLKRNYIYSYYKLAFDHMIVFGCIDDFN
ncbi:MAG: class I SAM-dependent methyltransferase [Ignavibacteriae bacterium]|nr:class I SAM-dependent methyltransferase [Ignavibacteriota bacterium]